MGTLTQMRLGKTSGAAFDRWCDLVNEVQAYFARIDGRTWWLSNAMYKTLHPELATLYDLTADFPENKDDAAAFEALIVAIRAEFARCQSLEDESV